jgi:hypothetical protein
MRMRPSHHRFFGWLLTLPFVILSLIPAAVMPMRGTDGTMVLVLCTGDGPVETVVTLAGGDDAPDLQPRCDWAASTAAALLPDIAPVPRPIAFARAALPPPALTHTSAHHPSGMLARGPPTTL